MQLQKMSPKSLLVVLTVETIFGHGTLDTPQRPLPHHGEAPDALGVYLDMPRPPTLSGIQEFGMGPRGSN